MSRPMSSQRHEMLETRCQQQSYRYAASLQPADTVLTRLLTHDDEAQTCQRDGGTANFARALDGGHYSDPRHF